MTDAVICCIAKNEGPYLLEWINYNLKLGFSKIYIYDNNNDKTKLQTYFNNEIFFSRRIRSKIILIHFPGPQKQIEAYNNFVKYHSYKHTWVAFIDCDEFIVLKNWEPITQFLSKVCKQGAVYLYWRIFGNSGHTNYSAEPVTERFTMCWKNLFHLGKCISVCKHLNGIQNPHFPKLKQGIQHDCSGIALSDAINYDKTKDKFLDFAYINHYFGKSNEEWQHKKNRGLADVPGKRTDEEFNAHNKNEVEDLLACNFYKNKDLDFST